MSTLKNKIVFITGASSGIGEACAWHFAAQKARLILTARRIDRLKKLATALRRKYHVDILPMQLDVQNKSQVFTTIEGLPKKWQKIDVLVNNAGLALSSTKIHEGDVVEWETMVNTNVLGLLYVTRAILPNMVARNCGHIINIGSIAGREYYLTGNVYCATKHAVKALNQSLRYDLVGTDIRVTEIAPGATNTEFSTVRWKSKERADQFYSGFTALVADDIANAVVYCAMRPSHVNVSEMVIYPTAQASPSCYHKRGQPKAKAFFE